MNMTVEKMEFKVELKQVMEIILIRNRLSGSADTAH